MSMEVHMILAIHGNHKSKIVRFGDAYYNKNTIDTINAQILS